MMGYTHAAIGAAGALAVATFYGDGSPEQFLIASVAGAVGGVAIDIDTRDNHTNPKVTDAGRTRLAAIGLVGVGVALDFILKTGILFDIIARQYFALGGLAGFIAVMLIGLFSPHRTFSHSLLFVLISSAAVYFICPEAVVYYSIGCLLHLIFDMLNHQFENHGIWLLYPIKTGKGIALGVCKAARKGNKVFYFIGIVLFALLSGFYIWQIGDLTKSIIPAVILLYMIVVMHFVRRKSEKEQRHIMHMRGEL